MKDTEDEAWFGQHPHRCRLEWGRRGARDAAQRGDVLVVVDVLSFSSAVVTAVAHGGIIYPCAGDEEPAALAERVGAQVAVHRRDVPNKGRFSLSPQTYVGMEPGTRVVLASPNGATCSEHGRDVPYLFVASFLNARAAAQAVSQVLQTTNLCVSIVACGERWQSPSEDGALRMAVEDYLGAGAVLFYLEHPKSPEARACEGAFRHVRDELLPVVLDCGSGRELRQKGFDEDVHHAAQLNRYDVVPVLRGERFEPLGGGGSLAGVGP